MTNKDYHTTFAITQRAKDMKIIEWWTAHLLMKDLMLADKIFGIKFDDLLESEPCDFIEDITGIQEHIDRKHETFTGGFIPLFSEKMINSVGD